MAKVIPLAKIQMRDLDSTSTNHGRENSALQRTMPSKEKQSKEGRGYNTVKRPDSARTRYEEERTGVTEMAGTSHLVRSAK